MKTRCSLIAVILGIAAALGSDAGLAAAPAGQVLKEGDVVTLGSRTVTVTKLEPPGPESAYAKRFRFDRFDNPGLQELRRRHRLDEVVAGAGDEFERQVLLMDWTHQQFRRFGRPSTNSHGALAILAAVSEGHTFFCAQYAEVLVSAAASLGWIDRPLALRRHQGVNQVGGSTEHSVTEIWSNQHRKWIMLDPTSNMYLTSGGVPLNAYEIRQEWFYHGGTNLVFVVGREQKKHRKSDLPIVLGTFPNFGELAVHPDELDKYGFIGYIPNTDLLDAGYDYGKMFIVKDQLCDGTKWHLRDLPAQPETDPYFRLGQATLALQPQGKSLRVDLSTFTPNFDRFEVRLNNGLWERANESFSWQPQTPSSRLEARTVNQFGVRGPVSTAAVDVKE